MADEKAIIRTGRPGRPKGLGKVPGSGRKKGTPNHSTVQTRERIAKEADPIGFLIGVSRGLQFERAPNPNSNERVKVRPTLEQSIGAAQTLARKIVPDMRAVEVSGDAGVPLHVNISLGAPP